VALWGDQSEKFEAEECIRLGQQAPVVLLICAVTTAICDGLFDDSKLCSVSLCDTFSDSLLFALGKLKITGSSTCRWYINPDIVEAEELRDRYDQLAINLVFQLSLSFSNLQLQLSGTRTRVAGFSFSGIKRKAYLYSRTLKYEDPHEVLVRT
jgi:hypothetical protein